MSRNPFRKTVGFYEVMATGYTEDRDRLKGGAVSTADAASSNYNNKAKQMDNPSRSNMSETESPRVGFQTQDQQIEKKKKFLTAKYGQHQMMLIRKRLAVEMWIFDELRKLYQSPNDDHDCELDLEDILDLDTDNERRQFTMEKLHDARQSQDHVHKFVEELIRQAKTL